MTADVDAATVNTDTVVLKNKVTGEVISTTVTYEAGSRYIIVTPTEDLAEETTYEITFDGIKTANGLKADKVTYTFTTGDFAAPSVVSVTPENGTDEVPLNKNIVINFSEGMLSSSLNTTNIVLRDLTANSDLTYTTYYSPSLSQDGKTYTLNSIKDLTVGHSYQLTIKGDGFTSGVQDDSNNYLASDVVVKFATVDATTTYLTKVQADTATTYASTMDTVESGVTSFANNKLLYFTFDKALKDGTDFTNATLTVEKKGISGSTFAAAWSSETTCTKVLVNSDKTVKITLPTAGTWDADTLYKVTLSGLKDINGNDVADQTFQFIVGTKPAYNTSNPVGFATNVGLDQKYIYAVIEDTESVLDVSTLSSTNVKIVKKSDQTLAPYALTSAQYAKPTAIETVTTISSGTTFTADDASVYSVGQLIKVGTQYVVVTERNTSTNVVTVDQTLTAGSSVAVKTAQGVVYTLNDDSKLEASTQYQLLISGVKDAAGNEADSVTKTFTTAADIQQLAFVSSTVADGDVNVPVDTDVVLTFNEEVTDATAVVANITIEDEDSNNLTGDNLFTVTKSGKTLTVSPKGFWKAGKVYTVTLTTTLASEKAALASAKTIQFQTESTASVTPKIVSAQYVEGTTNSAIVLTLNAPISSTVATALATSGNLKLDGANIDVVAASEKNDGYSVVLSIANSNLTTAGFVAGASKVAVTADTTDIMGNAFSTDAVVISK